MREYAEARAFFLGRDWPMARENAETLRNLIRTKLHGHKFVTVSNREPYVSEWRDGRREWKRPASGMVVALDPVMQATRGLWVAYGKGMAEEPANGASEFVDVPPGNPSYRLKRVWLPQEDEQNYYSGFSNSALWPLCHIAYRLPIFHEKHWRAYQAVNERFAQAVAEDLGNEPAFVFIQDYHFALLPRLLRQHCPKAVIAHFWHIPWPNPEVFRICPWKGDILRGLLGSDILGFHIRFHRDNFLATVNQELEARIDRERSAVIYRRHLTKVRAFPISIDFDSVSSNARSPETETRMNELRERYHLRDDVVLGVGADRLDYTKGLPERMAGIDRFLDRFPEYRGRFVFLQAGVPSRTSVPEYHRLNEEVNAAVERVNEKYGTPEWQPVIFVREHVPLAELLAWYRLARFVLVSSLHDGMNLVAKEFVASRADGECVLLLSEFTGAAREFRTDAVLINPYAADGMADAIHRAATMDCDEMRRRMRRMREQVRENNVYKWAADILRKLAKFV